MGCSERYKELKRRRHRRRKLGQLKKRVEKATSSEKTVIANKLRQLSPGGEQLAADWGLEKN